ncbi:TIGR04222 domain-containing membrane protein [Micromonospora sp. NPDC049374]|uniref:TIGR04222 domain-containing membrane protein n=1 Tax=Micromonospora sp. NPDC049374 TaxID=3154352 RepID=UPI003436EB0D
MTGFAVDYDTWGVPGPTFITLYLVATVIAVAVVLIRRRALLGGRVAPPADQLNPQQVAYLNGGDDFAVWTSLGALRSQGAIGVDPDRRLTADGPLPPAATQLDRAIHYAATQRTLAREVRRTEWVERAVTELRDGLDQRGLAIGPDRRAALRHGPLLLVALLVLGVARIVAGLANDRPVWYLVLTVLALAVLTTVLLVRVPRRTRAAEAALRTLRQRNRHLAPTANPAYATYGATGAAMAVALYGTASLWALDPTFAQQAEIQRQAVAGGATSTGGCGGGGTAGASCSGGSCGGGGCGGGCGG